MAKAVEEVTFERSAVIERLAEGPMHVRDLRDDLAVSRSTAYRALQELESHCIATRSDEGYRLTAFGDQVRRQYARHERSVRTLVAVRSCLADLPSDVTFPPELFTTGDVVTTRPENPDRLVDALVRQIQQATELVGFSPITRSRYLSLFRKLTTASPTRW
ncbi:hypothetical protein ACFQH6_04060 [Halobacteriaceae archaeon GCM10025711]